MLCTEQILTEAASETVMETVSKIIMAVSEIAVQMVVSETVQMVALEPTVQILEASEMGMVVTDLSNSLVDSVIQVLNQDQIIILNLAITTITMAVSDPMTVEASDQVEVLQEEVSEAVVRPVAAEV